MYFFNSVFNKLVYYYYNFYLFLSVYQTHSLLSLVKSDDLTAYDLIFTLLNNCRVCVDFFPEDFLVCLRINYLLRVLTEGLLVKINLKVTGHLTPSRVFYYPVLDWYEREAYDMFGLVFTNHPNLTRILSDYGFSGFPLKKEFPLTGFYEIFYSGEKLSIETRKVFLKQDYNLFNVDSSWYF